MNLHDEVDFRSKIAAALYPLERARETVMDAWEVRLNAGDARDTKCFASAVLQIAEAQVLIEEIERKEKEQNP